MCRAMGETVTNRKKQSARGSKKKAVQVDPLALAGLKLGEDGVNLWAFRYDESAGRLSHVLTCPESHAWRFEEIGGRARVLVWEMCAANARAMPEKCDDKETAEWIFGAAYRLTFDLVNDLSEMWTPPGDGQGGAVDADFVADVLSPFRRGLVSEFVHEAVGLPVVFVDENLDGQDIGEPSGPRWVRLSDDDLRAVARPLPERGPAGFKSRGEQAGTHGTFADCVLGGYPLERAFENLSAVLKWWGRALGCRAEAFEVDCRARSVMRWLCFDAAFTDDALRDLARRVQQLDDAAQSMAVAILRTSDRREYDLKLAELAPRSGIKGTRKRRKPTAIQGVSVCNTEIRAYYDDNRKAGETFADFWDRCKNETLVISGVTLTLADACRNDGRSFARMCKNGGRTARRKRAG